MTRVLSVLGLLLAPVALLASAEYEVWAHQQPVIWHIIDGILLVTMAACAVGIVASQPEKDDNSYGGWRE